MLNIHECVINKLKKKNFDELCTVLFQGTVYIVACHTAQESNMAYHGFHACTAGYV